MKQQAWWWVLAVAVIAGIAYWMISDMKEKAPQEEEVSTEETQELAAPADDTSILWEFGIMNENPETGAMMREVSITYKGVKRVVGTYPGSCSIVEESSWPLLENELTGVICWFAGAGTEVGVFYENGVRVVKVGSLEEGTAEISGSRGGFETAFALD